MAKPNTKLTSVKIITELYNLFKKNNVESGFTLQELVNKSIHLYNTDDNFISTIYQTSSSYYL